MQIAGKFIGPTSAVAAFILDVFWKVAKSGGGSGAGGTIKAKICEIVTELGKNLEASISAVEACDKQILVDWGNLETFGRLVDDGTLVWPPDAKNIRRAHTKGFHLVCLKSLMELKSKLETTKSHFEENTWGVVCRQTFTKKKGARHFDEKSGILYEATGEKGCGNYPITLRFLGTLHRDYREE